MSVVIKLGIFNIQERDDNIGISLVDETYLSLRCRFKETENPFSQFFTLLYSFHGK